MSKVQILIQGDKEIQEHIAHEYLEKGETIETAKIVCENSDGMDGALIITVEIDRAGALTDELRFASFMW